MHQKQSNKFIFSFRPVFKKLPKSRGLIKDPDRFDNEFFRISSEEADSMDAQVRVLHEVTFEALWDAGKSIRIAGHTINGILN